MRQQENFLKNKLYKPFSNDLSKSDFFIFVKKVLAADKSLIYTIMVYGIAISILSLAAPISVQLLINSVSFTAMLQPILVLGGILLLLVCLYGLVSILQFYICEIFQRRFFSRMSMEVGMSLLNAEHQTFEEANQAEMVNRFFDTVTIQKIIPKIFGKTFTIILQSFAGLILVACYHPFFLIFSFGIPLAIFLIWKYSSKNAIYHSFLESRRKYDLVSWLEDIARNHTAFKSLSGRNYAKFKINFITGLYLKEREEHFKALFSQVVFIYILYALTTAFLLVLGGWLVIKNQLSLGQLVASELVISAIVYNISNLSRDFESLYDLISSSEKLSQFQNIPSEKTGGKILDEEIQKIKFQNATYRYLDNEYNFNFNFLQNRNYIIFTNGYSTRKIVSEMILGFRPCVFGNLLINNHDIDDLDKYDLRSRIAIIDNSPLIEGTLREYLTFNHTDITDNQLFTILEDLDILPLILSFKDGLDTRIIPSGWPFSESEKIIIKIAKILINKPQIIIAHEVLDMLEPKIRTRIIHHLNKELKASFLYFSHRYDNLQDFDHKLIIEKNFSYEIKSDEDYNNFLKGANDK